MRIRSTVAAEQTARLDHGCSWKGWLPEVSWMRHVCWNHSQWRRNEPLHWRTHPQGLCWWPVWSMSTGWVCVKIIESMLGPFSSKCSYIPVILPHFPYRINISSSSNLKKKKQNKAGHFVPCKIRCFNIIHGTSIPYRLKVFNFNHRERYSSRFLLPTWHVWHSKVTCFTWDSSRWSSWSICDVPIVIYSCYLNTIICFGFLFTSCK